MVRVIRKTGGLSDAQIKEMYELATILKVWLSPWQDSPSPGRTAFKWAVEGNIFRVWRYLRRLGRLTS